MPTSLPVGSFVNCSLVGAPMFACAEEGDEPGGGAGVRPLRPGGPAEAPGGRDQAGGDRVLLLSGQDSSFCLLNEPFQ